jgi:type IV pilus assembly protein PilB
MATVGEMLVEAGAVTRAQLQAALEGQRARPGASLAEILVASGALTDRQWADAVARKTGCRSVDLDRVAMDAEMRHLIPLGLARRHHCLPIRRSEGVLWVAMVDPTDEGTLNKLSAACSCTVRAAVTGPEALQRGHRRLYGEGEAGRFATPATSAQGKAGERGESDGGVTGSQGRKMETLMQTAIDAAREIEPGADASEETSRGLTDIDTKGSSPIVRLVNSLLIKAVRMNASDIHVEPFEDEVRVRYRIDGALVKVLEATSSAKHEIVSRIKVMAMMDIAERRIPQDGRLRVRLDDGTVVDFRLNTLPSVHGEKVVLRILGQGEIRGDISQLGFGNEGFRLVSEAIKNPFGMILVTGPTGSGKTTTLYTILQQLNTEDVNIVTAEDPVEYRLKGITQVNVRPSIGFSFDTALRAFLRQDPDIILVGEMRDYETAAIATRAALTGHLVLSTVHTNDCPSTVVRLVDMGIEPYIVASSVKLVIAQRLVRRICPACREEVPVGEAEKMEVDEGVLSALEHMFRGKGCQGCHGIGYRGRAPVFEVMPVRTLEMKRVITEGATEVQVAQVAKKEGMRTLRDQALDMVNEGITTLEEAVGILMAEL